MVEHTAVAAVGEFPIPHQFEIVVLLIGYDIARSVAAFARSLNAAVDYAPAARKLLAVVVAPAVEILAVEEKLPTVGLLGSGQRVVLLARCRHACRERGDCDE